MDFPCFVRHLIRSKLKRRSDNSSYLLLLSSKQIEIFGTALCTRLMDSDNGATKRYLYQFVGEIRFDGKGVMMRGKKAHLLTAASQKERDITRVPTSVPNWLLDLGSNQGPTD
jgi:site-specific DNA recombinase